MGWNFKKLVEVGHKIADAYKHHLEAFAEALLHFDAAEIVNSEDHTGKWSSRRKSIEISIERGDRYYEPDRTTLALVGFLMPGTQEKLQKIILDQPG